MTQIITDVTGSLKQTEQWTCPDNCEIDYVLVCGGDLGDPDGPNVNFRMGLDGAYTDQFEDGSAPVPKECFDHADGCGCSLEPICPECRKVCLSLEVLEEAACRHN